MKEVETVEVITLYRGKDSATYLASDWEKYGTDAEPIRVTQEPGKNEPFHKMEYKDVDTFYRRSEPTQEGVKQLVEQQPNGWGKEALQKLLEGKK